MSRAVASGWGCPKRGSQGARCRWAEHPWRAPGGEGPGGRLSLRVLLLLALSHLLGPLPNSVPLFTLSLLPSPSPSPSHHLRIFLSPACSPSPLSLSPTSFFAFSPLLLAHPYGQGPPAEVHGLRRRRSVPEKPEALEGGLEEVLASLTSLSLELEQLRHPPGTAEHPGLMCHELHRHHPHLPDGEVQGRREGGVQPRPLPPVHLSTCSVWLCDRGLLD